MTAGEEAARHGLGESVHKNRAQMEMTQESRALLASMVREEMRTAVTEGITAALTDENAERFWNKGFEVAQKQAKRRLREGAGDLVIGGVRGLVKWGGGAVVVLGFAYYVGGWQLVKTVWSTIMKG
jgi:hypothetical protein